MENKIDSINTMCSLQSNIDSLSLSLLLGILGIAITIFTVIYSFMESTKQRKRELGDRISLLTDPDPVLESDLGFTMEYLRRMRRMNIAIIIIIFADIIAVLCYGAHMMMPDFSWLWYSSIIIEIVLFLGCLFTLFLYLLQYHRRFNQV